MFDQSIQQLLVALSRLPSVGPKTAERFVLYLLRSGKGEVKNLVNALEGVMQNVKTCSKCQNFTETNPCHICSDPKRDHSTICVVATIPDASAIEKTGEYRGTYHILRGVIDAVKGTMPKHLKIAELLTRVTATQPKIKEVILALNPTIPGETTTLYIQKELADADVTITRLARGLPIGADLAYADEVTLNSALKERKQLQ